jgi:hypothetical protein
MLTGRLPFAEPHAAALTGAIIGTAAPKVSSILPACPPALDAIVARALAKDPKQRYQTAREVTKDLRDVLRILDVESGADMDTLPPAAPPTPALTNSRPRTIALISVATFLGLTFAGFLTSTLYTSPLGMTIAFGGESPFWWPVWGLRSLVLPAAQIAFALLIVVVASEACRIVLTLGPLRRRFDGVVQFAGKISEFVRGSRTTTLAGALLVVQVIALRIFSWRFGHLVESIYNYLLQTGSIAALSIDFSDDHKLYMRVLSIFVLVFGWSWYRLLKLKAHSTEGSTAPARVAAAIMMLITFSAMTLPYRLFFQSRGELVYYQSEPCYLVGQKVDAASLFCPGSTSPWRKLVDLKDPALKRGGTIQRIFPGTRGN